MTDGPTRTCTIRPGEVRDLAALADFEHRIFAVDRLSRRSFRHFLQTPSAALLVGEREERFAGYALVLFRPRSAIGRLYSIGVEPAFAGQGIGPALLAAAERAAIARDCRRMRLEVQTTNSRAIRRYECAGYRLLGRRPRYYDDGSDALRYEKTLAADGKETPAGRKDSCE
jgi:ribosomal protein S18 acetylase RimI-like enzyme